MALTNCPECAAEISDQAFDCPKCGAKLKSPKRGFFGKLIKFTFVLFNILMIIWLFSYLGSVGEINGQQNSDAARTGVAIGATIGTGLIGSIWVMGDIILGLLVLLTRPKK